MSGNWHRLSPTWKAWRQMIRRCTDPKHCRSYIERGITVCDRWRSFANFLADMGERPDGKTIDRIDNDRGYEPDNCRWATRAEQQHNTRRTKLEEHEPAQIRWLASLGFSQRMIARHFGIAPSGVAGIVVGYLWRSPE